MKFNKRSVAATLAASTALGIAGPAWADGGAAVAGLFGGMLLSNAIHSGRESAYRSGYDAGRYEPAPPAYSPPPQTVYVQSPAPSGGRTAEQRIAELNGLREKGLISEGDYASRKKAILDSL